jgi:lipoyl-dependent peroxiredoxin subunit D
MEQLKAFLSARIPEWAKDVRLNVEAIDRASKVEPEVAWGSALAAAISAQSPELAREIEALMERRFGEAGAREANGAKVAAGLMSMSNYYYSFKGYLQNDEISRMPPGIRMQAYATHGGVDARNFEIYALAASVVGKCAGCLTGHADQLLKAGVFENEIQEIGRIASVVGGAAKMIAFTA